MTAKNGDTVRVHYTGTLEDGTVFDSSEGREPLEAVLGAGMLIPGFEAAVVGLAPGGRITVTIEPKDAYGERLEEMTITVPREEIPAHLNPQPGLALQVATEDGTEFEALVTEVTDSHISLDANHPLAGERLTFAIELVEIA